MGSRRRSLPLVLGSLPLGRGPLDLEAARARLGGRVAGGERAGEAVRVIDRGGIERDGVVLCVHEARADVWVGGGRVLRVDASALTASKALVAELQPVASAARAFGALVEGERVTWTSPEGEVCEGVLAEKCRYGGLVGLEQGLVAVGFQRLRRA